MLPEEPWWTPPYSSPPLDEIISMIAMGRGHYWTNPRFTSRYKLHLWREQAQWLTNDKALANRSYQINRRGRIKWREGGTFSLWFWLHAAFKMLIHREWSGMGPTNMPPVSMCTVTWNSQLAPLEALTRLFTTCINISYV